MIYEICEVSGVLHRDTINKFNALDPYFPPLQEWHFMHGFWWFAMTEDGTKVAFAGMVPFTPFERVGYLKRCYVLPAHRGRGLQQRFMVHRELKAHQLNYTHLVSECRIDNTSSADNFRRAGYTQTTPEQSWAGEALYWVKPLE